MGDPLGSSARVSSHKLNRKGVVGAQSRQYHATTESSPCSRANSLNFRVPTEPKASEFPKGIVLGRDGNIHVRLTGSTPLGYVGSYNPPPLGALRPRRHTSSHGLALIPNCHIPDQAPPYPGLDSVITRYCPLWAPTTPSRFCFYELTRAELPNGSPIMGLL